MKRVYIGELGRHADSKTLIQGWVHTKRNQGKMVFFEFRDMTGRVQGVVLPGNETLKTQADELRDEWVVEITGTINKRPEKNVQQDKINGDIEMVVESILVLNKAEVLPFQIAVDTKEIGEDTRLTHRYLDLRSERMQKNIRKRGEVLQFIRNELAKENFTEVETPLLTKSTPEGARDFVVPARLYPGSFYALPQSPQQYKQLLMTAGIERYFQVAKCLRDEDSRGDRQPEFTQLDMEMSFVEREDVMNLNEQLLINLVKTYYPEKRIQQIPFPRISYKEAMEKYGNDRPDIREDKNDENLLAFCWVIDFPFFERTDASDNPDTFGEWTFTHNPFSRPIPEHMENLMQKKNIGDIITSQYDITLNGYEIGGGSIRNHEVQALMTVFEILGYKEQEIKSNFGHMLTAFSLGTPPHGGIAWGFDRLMMLLHNEPNIREVMAFPKTGEGKDLMMQSPSTISDKQLKELSLELKLKKHA
jgi:aspartyl-tRNA synthetase